MTAHPGKAFVSTQQQFNHFDYTLLSIAAAALGGIYLIREYCRPLPLHKRAVVALKGKVLG